MRVRATHAIPGLDHIAVRVERRDAMAELLCERLGWHVMQRTERLTLLGSDAKAGKLTLLDARPEDRDARVRAVITRLWLTGDSEPVELQCDVDRIVCTYGEPVPGATDTGVVTDIDATDGSVVNATVEWTSGDGRPAAGLVLDHVGILVDDLGVALSPLDAVGVEHDRIDGPNALAAFITVAGGMRIELIEHLPEFALV